MKLEYFRADADIWGRRVWLKWRFRLDALESPGNVPRVLVRRNERDFEFRPPDGDAPDPLRVYDSAAFPPDGSTLKQAPVREWREGAGRVEKVTESALVAGKEILRRELATRFESGRAVEITTSLLDAARTLVPFTAYYYELEAPDLDGQPDRTARQASAVVTEHYDLGKKMYDLLPEIHRRHDTQATPVPPSPFPEAAGPTGQLRRFLDVLGAALDYLRSQAEALRELHDIDNVEARYLPLLADWIGWNLRLNSSIPLQRHEIRYAAELYRITGTIPGSMVWVKRLTTWDNRVKEFGRNVFFSNDTGNPDDPTDKGSRTVETADPNILARIKTFDDDLDYTYDSGEDAWYAYDTIGLFVKPATGAPTSEIDRTTQRLKRNLNLFLPTNIRAVVILDISESSSETIGNASLLGTEVD